MERSQRRAGKATKATGERSRIATYCALSHRSHGQRSSCRTSWLCSRANQGQLPISRLEVYPDCEGGRLPDETACRSQRRRSRHDSHRELDSRPRRRHPPHPAERRRAHHQRHFLPVHHQLVGNSRGKAREHPHGEHIRRSVVPPDAALPRHRAVVGADTGGVRPRDRRSATRRAPPSPSACRRDLRARRLEGRLRGHRAQHHALQSSCRRSRLYGPNLRHADRHHLHLRVRNDYGGALQGARRHSTNSQHDQARRAISSKRPVLRHPVLCRCRRSRRIRR